LKSSVKKTLSYINSSSSSDKSTKSNQSS
jgi:hypothetical protein